MAKKELQPILRDTCFNRSNPCPSRFHPSDQLLINWEITLLLLRKGHNPSYRVIGLAMDLVLPIQWIVSRHAALVECFQLNCIGKVKSLAERWLSPLSLQLLVVGKLVQEGLLFLGEEMTVLEDEEVFVFEGNRRILVHFMGFIDL